jgi:hypothetical protein
MINEEELNNFLAGSPPSPIMQSYRQEIKKKMAQMDAGRADNSNVVTMGVERCENGFVLMSGGKKRIAKDMEELTRQFTAMLVDKKLTD